MATEMFLKALGHIAAFAQEEHTQRESRRGPTGSRGAQPLPCLPRAEGVQGSSPPCTALPFSLLMPSRLLPAPGGMGVGPWS